LLVCFLSALLNACFSAWRFSLIAWSSIAPPQPPRPLQWGCTSAGVHMGVGDVGCRRSGNS
jgi:hypothetical protein